MITENEFYGIFSDEADDVIALVRDHHQLAEIEAHRCPKCCASLRVGYYPDGEGFYIHCSGAIMHSTQYQQLLQPPAWWRERVIEVTDWIESKKTRVLRR